MRFELIFLEWWWRRLPRWRPPMRSSLNLGKPCCTSLSRNRMRLHMHGVCGIHPASQTRLIQLAIEPSRYRPFCDWRPPHWDLRQQQRMADADFIGIERLHRCGDEVAQFQPRRHRRQGVAHLRCDLLDAVLRVFQVSSKARNPCASSIGWISDLTRLPTN